jgi:sulfatase maturation enzyme AslB (radical SAM superfamily)
MINYVITGSCAKNCTFCFTDESARKEDALGEMSIETFSKALDHVNHHKYDGQVKILGGEPTQHSDFPGIINEVIKRDLKVDLISNFLFGEETLQFIEQNIDHFNWFLPNAMELDQHNRMKLFKKNYMRLYSLVKQKYGINPQNDARFFLAYTLSKDYETTYNYLLWLIKELDGKVPCIRIGIDLTGSYVINNKKLGALIDRIYQLAERNKFYVYFDCAVPPCLWDTPRPFSTYVSPEDGTCGWYPTDMFPDGTMIRCYPTKSETKLKTLFEYPNIETIKQELNDQYRTKYSEIGTPKECLECIHYKVRCNGICLGCTIGARDENKPNESVIKFYDAKNI